MEKTYLNSVDIPDPITVKYVNSFPPEKRIFKYLCEDNIEYECYMYHHFYDCHDLNIRTFFNGEDINDMRRCLFPVDTYIKSVVLPTIDIIRPLLAKGLMKVKVIQPIVKPITPEDIIRYPHCRNSQKGRGWGFFGSSSEGSYYVSCMEVVQVRYK